MSIEATPSVKLAALTVDQLIKSGLLRADKREVLINKIAAGKMNGSDWKLEIDLAQDKGGQK